jgi:hypothetical protein
MILLLQTLSVFLWLMALCGAVSTYSDVAYHWAIHGYWWENLLLGISVTGLFSAAAFAAWP